MNFLRRSADILVARAALVVTAPLLLVLALRVKIHSRGPIFDLRRELGPRGEVVTFYRFRIGNPGGPPGRLTSLGVFLRRYRLDELPLLFNVLKGDMSLFRSSPATARRPDRIDGRRALRLIGESVREMGILVFVFAPLDASFRAKTEEPGLVARNLVLIEALALCAISVGIIMESVTFATRSREDE
jgi:hypothetical protein